MARRAVAATLASVVLLTVLVAADATVMSAQDSLAAAAQTSRLESRELLLEQSLAGSASLQVLAKVQDYLSSNPAECDALPGYVSSLYASSFVSGEDSGVAYAANATAVGVGTAPSSDNLTIIAPFSGGRPGALNLREVWSVKEVGGGGSVSLDRRETHALNLPIEVGSASSLCASALGAIALALSQARCNATLERAAFLVALPAIVGEAAAQGFVLTAGWESGAAACSAAYWVTLVEPGVAGATGSFDWMVRGSGTAA